jgi:predicted glutamine amidotransferase
VCRLFGMSGGTHDVEATFWLLDATTSLILQSEHQPDGVGLGTFDDEDGTPHVWKKPTQANRSETFVTGARKARSRTFLAHIRHATATPNTLENTHPFEQNGRLFAHNGIVGDLEEIRRRLGPYTELMHGETDSEHYFTMITKAIDEAGGDVGAGIEAALTEMAADIAIFSVNMILATPTDLWALRYPETNELWLLEHSVGGLGGGESFDEQSEAGMRIQAHELSFLPAAVIASERMNTNPAWRLLEPGELIHVDSQLNVTSKLLLPEPPVHLMHLGHLTAKEAIAMGQTPVAEAGPA